jgi:hypothetical protein|nr:MAG TPA: hypothetical protein [Caudoviricetes sp.]
MVLSDFSDVDSWFDEETARVLEKERDMGVETVEYAKDNGNYQDHTGLLRKSNDFEVDEQGLLLKNETEYASCVESKGFDVLSGTALFAEKKLKEEFE